MSNVLVIHPDDRSTDFLKLIYQDKDYDVINACDMVDYKLAQQIDLHDKIIMLGHGTPAGLMNPAYFFRGGYNLDPYIIDGRFIHLLKSKETISIWCHSDKFFRPYNIKGFHTGMIISETSEQAYVLGKVYLNTDEQLENMQRFAKVVGECIEEPPIEMKGYILDHYKGEDPVTKFNKENIIVL